MKPPSAKKVPVEITQHGITRTDNYAWLRDKNWQSICDGDVAFENSEILDYLNSENAYTQEIMRDSIPLQQELEAEFLSRINEDRTSFSTPKKEWLYYQRYKKGFDYPLLCRRLSTEETAEVVYFDANAEAAGRELFSLRASGVSPENSFFAYAFNLSGSMKSTLRVRDLKTLRDFPWEIPNVADGLIWADDKNLLYVDREADPRGKNIYVIDVTKGPDSRKCVFTKSDEFADRHMEFYCTTDKNFIVVYLSSGSSTTLYVSKREALEFKHFVSGNDDERFELAHHNGSFYILTIDAAAPDGRVFCTSSVETSWDKQCWREYFPQTSMQTLESIHIYNDFIILSGRNNARAEPVLLVHSLLDGSTKTAQLPDSVCVFYVMYSDDPRDLKPRVYFQSPVCPESLLELDLATAKLSFIYREVLPNFRADDYVLKRDFARARDGELVPLTIIHHKSFIRNGSGKAIVEGYGSYGHSLDVGFFGHVLSLVDRGFCFCIAHVRGGADKGHSWYLQGKRLKKMNSFFDLIDSCEHLFQEGYAHKDYLAVMGGSAGGLLVTAAKNLRPDLFRAVIAQVPFVDVINTISDETLPLTPPEWEEWGNPIKSADDFHYMMKYSPYDNVQTTCYPAMLFDSGISDEQVTYWEPAKMVAKLREHKTDDNVLLLNMRMSSGHAGSSKRYERFRELAFHYSFFIKTMS